MCRARTPNDATLRKNSAVRRRPRHHVVTSKTQSDSYLVHKQSGRAVASWTDPTGTRRSKLLPGKFRQSRIARRVRTTPSRTCDVADVATSIGPTSRLRKCSRRTSTSPGTTTRTPTATPSKELPAIKSAMNPVDALYGDLNAAEFGPQKLKVVRQKMIDSDWCRSLVNRRINCIRRIFKWAASEELVPVSTFEALRTLAGLRRGRTEARESAPVRPVDPAVVDSTLPHLPTHIRAIVQLLRFTGMRPAEVCRDDARANRPLRRRMGVPADDHKTKNAGKDRAIPSRASRACRSDRSPTRPRSRAGLADLLAARRA